MTTVPVVWATWRDDTPATGYWDHQLLVDTLDRTTWRPANAIEYQHRGLGDHPRDEGCVLVVPGRAGSAADVNAYTAAMPWVLVILTSDEEHQFDYEALSHPRMAVWVQAPNPDRHRGADGFLPMGYPTGTPELAARYAELDRPYQWVFEGQVTHIRRQQCVRELRNMGGGLLLETSGFAAGVPREAYMADMAAAQLAPAPGGPISPDSFRLWEALEAGCVPLGDVHPGAGPMDGYWPLTLGEAPVWPLVHRWQTLRGLVRAEANRWPQRAAEVGAWYQQWKRGLAYRLDDQVRSLADLPAEPAGLADLITVLVPTSPIPSNPDLSILQATLASLATAGLGGCEVIVMADGVRTEQADRQAAYQRAIHQLVHHCEHDWPQVLPVVHAEHQHQARMTRHALGLVRTPLVLFVEHDCPLDGEFDWPGLCDVLTGGHADLVRFHHEASVLDAHRPLMYGDGPTELAGVPLWPTWQWSQRPHLARADYYRRILADHFDPAERWMIEDRMHSVLEQAHNSGSGWTDHRVAIYHADGPTGIRRSLHLDGRAGDPKWTDR